jgi:hypothetical protein
MLDGRITDFASLVGLVLVLLTLFTSQRATAIRELPASATAHKIDGVQEVVIDAVLVIFTCLLFVVGLPISVDAVKHLHPLAFSGPLRGAFVITWILLPGLAFWQTVLVIRAWRLLPELAA